MNEVLGHIYGHDLTNIQFVCDSVDKDGNPRSVEIGELLIVEDSNTKELFIIRVTKPTYGQDPKWSRQVARGKNRVFDTSEIEEEIGTSNTDSIFRMDRKEQLFLCPECELLGYINKNGKFLTPKRLPSYFSAVRKPTEADFAFLTDYLGDIQFGKVRSGSQVVPIGAGLFGELFSKHIGVFAQTGGGKSNTMLRLVGEVMEKPGQFGLLLFEPHGEYIHTLKTHPYYNTSLECYSQDGKEGRKIRVSYSEITVNAMMNIRKQMQWTEPQERFMREAETKFQSEWFRFLIETPVNMDEAQHLNIPVMTTLKEQFPNTFEDTIKVTKSKLMRLQNAPYFVRDKEQSDVDRIMSLLDQGKVVLIDMAALSGVQEILLSTILSNKLLSRRKSMYVKNREEFQKLPPVSIVLEEAQRVLGRDNNSDSNVFAQICNEGRKFLTGLLAITQQPKLMDPVLISQFNTLIILSISDETDFGILAGISKKPLKKLQTEIQSLMPGEAVVTSPLSPFALPIKVDFYDDYVKRIKPPVTKEPKASSFKGFI